MHINSTFFFIKIILPVWHHMPLIPALGGGVEACGSLSVGGQSLLSGKTNWDDLVRTDFNIKIILTRYFLLSASVCVEVYVSSLMYLSYAEKMVWS